MFFRKKIVDPSGIRFIQSKRSQFRCRFRVQYCETVILAVKLPIFVSRILLNVSQYKSIYGLHCIRFYLCRSSIYCIFAHIISGRINSVIANIHQTQWLLDNIMTLELWISGFTLYYSTKVMYVQYIGEQMKEVSMIDVK